MKNLSSHLALITGGASGIGKIMTRMLLERGAKVVIWDINEVMMQQTVKEFESLGEIRGYKVDISSLSDIKKTAGLVKSEVGDVDILINNAGIVVGKYFRDHSHEDIERTLNVNTKAPMWITLEFLDAMMEKNYGHICNIASSAGLISNPKMSVYAASKWAVVGWSDSLRIEMNRLKKDLKITTIMPYYINTGMFDGVQSKIPILNPEKAARTIVQSIEKGKKMVTLPGYIYRFVRFGQFFMSVNFFDWFADKVMGVYSTMDNFKGRKDI